MKRTKGGMLKKLKVVPFFMAMILNNGIGLKAQDSGLQFFAANHPAIRFTGRVDFSNPEIPRYWQPAVYFETKFTGSKCEIIIQDEVLWNKNHNYLEVVVDGKAVRLQTKSQRDTIVVADNLKNGVHTLLVSKNTEANIGYIELVGIRASTLEMPDPLPKRKIECIGNSITCGASADMQAIPCGQGVWHDQHNAYMSYASQTARALNAQYILSSVSGIGLIHSCCNLDILMPQVFDKVSMRNNQIKWDFRKYQPDVVTICLGQNDGIQDSTAFVSSYISFVKKLRTYYPVTTFVLLTSPMADDNLRKFLATSVQAVTKVMNSEGDRRVFYFVFENRYIAGCDYHPSVQEHGLIANQLTPFLQKIMHW